MRCLSCDAALTDFEATRRYAESGEFVDTCNKCLKTIPNFPRTIERFDLLNAENIDDGFDDELGNDDDSFEV